MSIHMQSLQLGTGAVSAGKKLQRRSQTLGLRVPARILFAGQEGVALSTSVSLLLHESDLCRLQNVIKKRKKEDRMSTNAFNTCRERRSRPYRQNPLYGGHGNGDSIPCCQLCSRMMSPRDAGML
ncbi:unnamed protein product [Peronospora destructor]|uniref:Uncharacterized protein n=1 Tax=Peronospora destructor TaxID=86335 RepID=A0AAV0V3V3_9STRA|nr:unnamed protein product [Peronospora destructor]